MVLGEGSEQGIATRNFVFGQSEPVVSDHTVMGNVLWTQSEALPPSGQCYTTCDSLWAYQPTSLTSAAPAFADAVWNFPGVAIGGDHTCLAACTAP